jgi:hypothetical protein
MAASGLTKATSDLVNHSHVTAMADFSLRLISQLTAINEHSFNNFKIRVGMNIGKEGTSAAICRFSPANTALIEGTSARHLPEFPH